MSLYYTYIKIKERGWKHKKKKKKDRDPQEYKMLKLGLH